MEENTYASRIAFSRSESCLALMATNSSGKDLAQVRLVDADSLKEIGSMDLPPSIESWRMCKGLQFCGKGRRILVATASNKVGRIWMCDMSGAPQKPELLAEVNQFELTVGTTPFSSTQDGKLIAVLTNPKGVRLLNGEDGSTITTHTLENEKCHTVSFSPDGKKMAITSADREPLITIINTATGDTIHQFKGHRAWIGRLKFLRGGSVLASSSADQTIRLWDLETLEPIKALRGHNREIWALDNLPDDSLVSGSKSGEIKIWSWQSEQNPEPFNGIVPDSQGITAFSFSPDSRSVFCYQDSSVVRYHGDSFHQRKEVLIFKGNESCLLQQQGWLCAYTDEENSIIIVDMRNRQLQGSISNDTKDPMESVAFNQEGNGLWMCRLGETTLEEWKFGDTEASQKITLPYPLMHDWYGYNCNMDKKGWLLGKQEELHTLWMLNTTDKEKKTFKWDMPQEGMLGNPTISSGFKFLAMSNEPQNVFLWDLSPIDKGGVPILNHVFDGALMSYHAVTFSSDEKRLVGTSGFSQIVTLWETELFEPLLTLPGQGWAPQLVSFSPDGNTLATCSNAGLHLWTAPSFEDIEAAEKSMVR